MTEGFWQAVVPGAFIAEYPLVRKASDRGERRVDALILPDERHGRARAVDFPDLHGRNVVIVQTKAGRMGMYLMGQAVFSARLATMKGAAHVRSILLCHDSDAALMPLLAPFPNVEVWLSDRADPEICKRAR
jgi:hypothetical protein